MAKRTTRDRLKIAARQLIATRGLDVGVRDILHAAGARNTSALGYHFGSKDGLIAELLNDIFVHAARQWEERLATLGGLEHASTRQVIEILVDRATWYAADDAENVQRFLSNVLRTQQGRSTQIDGILPTVQFNRLLAQIARNEPAIDPATMRQRLVFLAWYLLVALSGLEDAKARAHPGSSIWSSPNAEANLVETALGLLHAPMPAEQPKPRRSRTRPAA